MKSLYVTRASEVLKQQFFEQDKKNLMRSKFVSCQFLPL